MLLFSQPTEIADTPSKVGIFLCQYPCSYVVKSAVTKISRNIAFAGCVRRNCAFQVPAGVSPRLSRRVCPRLQFPCGRFRKLHRPRQERQEKK